MRAQHFDIAGPIEIFPKIHSDHRGYFVETFNAATMADLGIAETEWVQDNQSFSAEAYTLRGMHFQTTPFAQAKIVRVLRGAIYDVIVDLRANSPTFGKWLGVTLDAEQMHQLYVPKGFAHGFLTLQAKVEVAYKVSEHYSKEHDRSLHWSDKDVGIVWPMPENTLSHLSEKDKLAPALKDIEI